MTTPSDVGAYSDTMDASLDVQQICEEVLLIAALIQVLFFSTAI